MAAEKRSGDGAAWQFREYYLGLRSEVEESALEEFGKLSRDEERIRFVSEVIPLEKQPIPKLFGGGKDVKSARALRELGNKAFGKSEYKEALKLYSESILICPADEGGTDLALTIANRSAALYHLQHYQTALVDIDLVLSLNYPKDLKYKVLERKAKCMLALKKHQEALLEFKNTIKALDESKLPSERKMKMQKDIQMMVGIMTKPGSPESGGPPCTARTKMVSSPDIGKNQTYEAASDKVEIREEPSAGRFACAAEDIGAGETILIEKAYCSVLLREYSRSNCQHCFKRVAVPYSCDKCSFVIFCSLKCREVACGTYHKYECPVFTNLHHSGVSITVLMALRIISQKNLQYFLHFRDKLEVTREPGRTYDSSNYFNVYHLVRHEGLRKKDDFFERSLMALFLLRCLIKANYFGDSTKEERPGLSAEEEFIGGLLLRHLQILQFNAHEISELEIRKDKDLSYSKSTFIGGGLYATLALFNHSCDPGIVRYFEGTKVIVRAAKPIKKGEMIAENYGPIYSQMRKKERQQKLQSQYWFQCNCIPCQELWPTFDEIDKSVIRFRCDARSASGDKLSDCRRVLCVPIDAEDCIIKCSACGKSTNLFRGLRILQETDAKYKQASKYLKDGNLEPALATYLGILSTLHEILAPPFHDYLLCQQSIRKCMLALGNSHVRQF